MKNLSLSLLFCVVLANHVAAQVTTILDFGDTEFGSYPDFLTISEPNLYGIARSSPGGGASLFRVTTDGTIFAAIHTFDHESMFENYPGRSFRYFNGSLYGFKQSSSQPRGALYCQPIGGQQTFLHEFGVDYGDGAYPTDLTGFGSVFYGVTDSGGDNSFGTIFQIYSNGSGYKILHSFDGFEAFSPFSVLLSGSSLYGTTTAGGPKNLGTVFRADTLGVDCSVLHAFEDDGDAPLYPKIVGSLSLLQMDSAKPWRVSGCPQGGCGIACNGSRSPWNPVFAWNRAIPAPSACQG